MPSGSAVTLEWVRSVLSSAGYDAHVENETLKAKHATRPNVLMKLRPDLGLLTVSHFWGMKKPGWGGAGKILEAVNKANSISWYSTFFRDNDGDLGVTSYMVLSSEVSEEDVSRFLEREAAKFTEVLMLSGLREYIL